MRQSDFHHPIKELGEKPSPFIIKVGNVSTVTAVPVFNLLDLDSLLFMQI